MNYKDLFPVYKNNKDLVYLDSAASSLKPYEVIDGINDYYNNYSTNIERGLYSLSLNATKIVEDTRSEIAEFVNANKKEIIYTRGASESLNQVVLSLRSVLKEGDEVITSELEHHSSFLPLLKLKKEIGIKLVFVKLNEKHEITFENVKNVVTDKTRLIALTHVSNVLGCVTPVKEICEYAHKHNIIVSIDGAQAIPHMRIDVKDLDVDFYSFSFHKMCGPTGLGILYGKKELLNKIDPVFLGGEMNDEVSKSEVLYKEIPHKFETGTLPIAEIFGARAAIKFINKIGYETIEEKSKYLANYVRGELLKMEDVEIYSTESPILSFNVKGVHSHDAIHFLTEEGICLRAGHHCAEILHTDVLKVPATIRASFYFYNDKSDCDKFIEALKKCINFFKEVSYIG